MRFLFGKDRPRADWLVVGLGNPGDAYAGTRHNIGYRVASRLARRARLEFDRKAADARIAEGTLGQMRVAIARPHTYMNESGRAVRKLLDRYSLDPERMVIVYDDVDLPLGRIRIRASGGPGTHNGMRSVLSAIRTEAFPRVRCGIAPADLSVGMPPITDYVLTLFSADEREAAEAMIDRAAQAVEVLLRDGVARAMDTFNAGQ